ncbi:thioesterase family protein [Ruegeria sp.]|uniref:thioesterase family protein n=1 Tax=Ruegeria sp. TaxID=1879320 RepID=UPI003AFF81E6
MSAHLHECAVKPDWIDYNGHLRDAYYGLAFSYAVDAFMIEIGIDAQYRKETGGTWYVVEDHRCYLSEVTAQDCPLIVRTRVAQNDDKRTILLQELLEPGTEKPSATCEALQLHVVQKPEPRVASLPKHILERLDDFRASENDLPNLTLHLKRR